MSADGFPSLISTPVTWYYRPGHELWEGKGINLLGEEPNHWRLLHVATFRKAARPPCARSVAPGTSAVIGLL